MPFVVSRHKDNHDSRKTTLRWLLKVAHLFPLRVAHSKLLCLVHLFPLRVVHLKPLCPVHFIPLQVVQLKRCHQLHDFSHRGSLLLLARDAARKSQNTSSVLVATIIVVTSFIEYRKSKPTLRREACSVLNFNLKTIFYSAAKITIFHNITKYLLEKNSFFNFFLEIEQIIAIFAPAYCLLWQIVCVINY